MGLAKGLIRIQPLVSVLASSTGLTGSTGMFVGGTTGPMVETFTGEAFAISTASSTERKAYGGIFLTSSVDGVAWTMKIQSATACAMASPTDRFTFAAQSCSGAQMAVPLDQPNAGSTDEQFYRAVCTAASTTDFRLGLIWVGFN
jgi:hypothetical protein